LVQKTKKKFGKIVTTPHPPPKGKGEKKTQKNYSNNSNRGFLLSWTRGKDRMGLLPKCCSHVRSVPD